MAARRLARSNATKTRRLNPAQFKLFEPDFANAGHLRSQVKSLSVVQPSNMVGDNLTPSRNKRKRRCLHLCDHLEYATNGGSSGLAFVYSSCLALGVIFKSRLDAVLFCLGVIFKFRFYMIFNFRLDAILFCLGVILNSRLGVISSD